jgi:diguanylate cyclase (GGDEF)-like protein
VSDSQSDTIVRFHDSSRSQRVDRGTPVLVVIHGSEIGRRYLVNERSLVIGRDPQHSGLAISDPTVSGRHAVIQVEPEDGSCMRIDLGSRNGTFVNGTRSQETKLSDGDKIFLGDTILKFSFQDELESDFHNKLDRLMNTDELTGLYLKRPFDIEFNKAFQLARQSGRPLSLLMMDMDGLKAINTEQGHQMGSFCVAAAGKIVGEIMASHGVASRFGGDEFIAFVHDLPLEEAMEVGEEIRRSVEGFAFADHGVRVPPTISIGVAELTDSVQSAQELVRLADEALYRAKRIGKNLVSS